MSVPLPPYIRYWLMACIGLVLLMVAVGGLTRLTESGLSIVEWKLVTGTLPPFSDAAWSAEFADYQATPEFRAKNFDMNVQDFKRIYWLEYLHRLLGRLIGLAFLLPLLIITLRRDAPKRWLLRWWGIFALICAQGAVGWYMVQSGLVHDPWVSPYRLAFHLSLATVILGCLYLSYVSITRERPHRASAVSITVLALIAVQIIWGAFVAGLDAGLIYNQFPQMGGSMLPDELLAGGITDIFTQHASAQFMHRWFAFAVFAAIILQWVILRHRYAALVAFIASVQVVLGIATLLSHVQIGLASTHQLVAMLLVLSQLRVIYEGTAQHKALAPAAAI